MRTYWKSDWLPVGVCLYSTMTLKNTGRGEEERGGGGRGGICWYNLSIQLTYLCGMSLSWALSWMIFWSVCTGRWEQPLLFQLLCSLITHCIERLQHKANRELIWTDRNIQLWGIKSAFDHCDCLLLFNTSGWSVLESIRTGGWWLSSISH